MEGDVVHLPKTREVYASRVGEISELSELAEEALVITLLELLARQLLG